MAKLFVVFLCISTALSYAESFEALASEAAAARDANDVPRAAALYRQALELKPDWAEGWFFLGSLSYDADHYEAGREALSRFVKLDQKAAAGWSLLGLCEFETGAYGQSLDHIRHALQLGSGIPPEMLPALQFHEAQLLTRAGLFDQATEKYIPITQQGSPSPVLFSGIGLAALRTPMLVKDIPNDRANLFSTAGVAVYLWIAGQTEPADRSFRGLVAHYPTMPNVHCIYGTYLLPSHPDQAMSEFKQELEIDPGSAQARALIAQQLAQQEEQAPSAFEYAARAAHDGPAVPLAQYIYGLLLTRKGDLKEGIPHLEAAEKLDPESLEYHLALGGAYSKSGRVEDARRERMAATEIAKGTR